MDLHCDLIHRPDTDQVRDKHDLVKANGQSWKHELLSNPDDAQTIMAVELRQVAHEGPINAGRRQSPAFRGVERAFRPVVPAIRKSQSEPVDSKLSMG